ncbi:MAG: hypothetical protein Phog2KO_07610 [Phototrophicaceae bacterium]
MAQLLLEKTLFYFDKVWKITLLSVVTSILLSGYLSYIFNRNQLTGMIIGGLVAFAVSYPVSYFIIKTQEQLRRQNADLQALNKELENYNRILTHDIKNKASVISLASYMIMKSTDGDDKLYHYARNIKMASEDLRKIIDDIKKNESEEADNPLM